jgi:hypothetical protein
LTSSSFRYLSSNLLMSCRVASYVSCDVRVRWCVCVCGEEIGEEWKAAVAVRWCVLLAFVDDLGVERTAQHQPRGERRHLFIRVRLPQLLQRWKSVVVSNARVRVRSVVRVRSNRVCVCVCAASTRACEPYGFVQAVELGESLHHRLRFRGRQAEELHVVHLYRYTQINK